MEMRSNSGTHRTNSSLGTEAQLRDRSSPCHMPHACTRRPWSSPTIITLPFHFPAPPALLTALPQVAGLSLELSNMRRSEAQINGELALTQQQLAQAQQELSDGRCAHSRTQHSTGSLVAIWGVAKSVLNKASCDTGHSCSFQPTSQPHN
jgi:hypothetical protein